MIQLWKRRIGAVAVAALGLLVLAPAAPAFAATPATPGVFPLQAGQLSVTLHWFDQANNEDGFFVKRNNRGRFVTIARIASSDVAGTGRDYTFVDTDTDFSGQCYQLVAFAENPAGPTFQSPPSAEQCTVRPDPGRFPQSIPNGVREWSGLSGVNGGTGTLANKPYSDEPPSHLYSAHQTFGPDLEWRDTPSLWKVQARDGGQVMKGEAVALRVWGGGWMKHSASCCNIDIELTDEPSFEWYVLGGVPGEPLNLSPDGDTTFAIWNSVQKDYLVRWGRQLGVDLAWRCFKTQC